METIQIVCEVPNERAEFMLELLHSLDFVQNVRVMPSPEATDDTDRPETESEA